ncbi:MAG: helix-turn-helix transcriptional regulator [Granulosicoccus sp.]
MKKFDRVTSILIYLQTKSVVTARELADRFDVSERTIYRDLRSLENAGVPIGAEAGVGYYLDKSYRLPPVVFTREEGASLLFGARMIESRVDEATREQYMMALDKIRSVMESEDQNYLDSIDDSIAVYKPKLQENTAAQDTWLPECRTSLSRSQVVSVHYEAGFSQKSTQRELEPIGLYYYSYHWHLIAWCRLREGYRDFRLDRIRSLTLKPEQFVRRDHASLQEYLELGSNRELHEIIVNFSFDAARFAGEQRYNFGFVRERDTEEGVEMTFVTPYLDYIARWLLQFASGASSDNELLKPVMEKLVAELGSQWSGH